MDRINQYKAMKDKHQQEVNAFPIAFAFNNEQFARGMAQLGLTPEDTDKVYGLAGTGGFYRREDAPRFGEMLNRHEADIKSAIAADPAGDGFIFDMFDYELRNHEYTYTNDLTDTLEALDLTPRDIDKDERLLRGLKKAIKAQKYWASHNA